jgi:hypothetical protein
VSCPTTVFAPFIPEASGGSAYRSPLSVASATTVDVYFHNVNHGDELAKSQTVRGASEPVGTIKSGSCLGVSIRVGRCTCGAEREASRVHTDFELVELSAVVADMQKVPGSRSP